MNPNQTLVSNLLRELNVRWNLDCLNLEDGRCFVRTDDHIELIIEVPEEVGQILFFAEIEPLGHVNRQEKLESVMTASLGDPDLRLAHFGLDPSTDLIYLTYHHPVDGLGTQFLENILVNFVQCARSAREKLQSFSNSSQGSSGSGFGGSEIMPPPNVNILQQKPPPSEQSSSSSSTDVSSASVSTGSQLGSSSVPGGGHTGKTPAAGSFRR